jgi:hypothetical protein
MRSGKADQESIGAASGRTGITYKVRCLVISGCVVRVRESCANFVYQFLPYLRILSAFPDQVHGCERCGIAASNQESECVLYQLRESQLASSGFFVPGVNQVPQKSALSEAVAILLDSVLNAFNASLRDVD